jgi:hypothetical protein
MCAGRFPPSAEDREDAAVRDETAPWGWTIVGLYNGRPEGPQVHVPRDNYTACCVLAGDEVDALRLLPERAGDLVRVEARRVQRVPRVHLVDHPRAGGRSDRLVAPEGGLPLGERHLGRDGQLQLSGVHLAPACARVTPRGYTIVMSSSFHSVALEALNLDEADRLRLATELIDSVEGPADPEWDDAWLAEIQARRQRGTADAVPWSEARARVLRRLSAS